MYTLLVVLCGWVLFRADSLSQAAFYLRAMFVWTPCGALSTPAFFINALTVTAAVVALLLCGPLQAVVPGMKRWIYDEDRISWSHSLLLIPLLGLCILCLSSGAYNPFIYFRF